MNMSKNVSTDTILNILHKIENAVYSFHNSLCHGYIFVWNLPQYQRTYKAYLWTERYIKYTLKYGNRQLRAIFKLYKFIIHDNGVGKFMLEHKRTAILHEMDILLKDYNIMDYNNHHLLAYWDAEKRPLFVNMSDTVSRKGEKYASN